MHLVNFTLVFNDLTDASVVLYAKGIYLLFRVEFGTG
ncbi:uncharacterized protein METZ01_LOCUS378070 [marine metagenome]|uniref:Uncharacterized protein n=1 Tax=marine metagenome TaxID=408172 RepID=A0A382TT35_9ZZZZ